MTRTCSRCPVSHVMTVAAAEKFSKVTMTWPFQIFSIHFICPFLVENDPYCIIQYGWIQLFHRNRRNSTRCLQFLRVTSFFAPAIPPASEIFARLHRERQWRSPHRFSTPKPSQQEGRQCGNPCFSSAVVICKKHPTC